MQVNCLDPSNLYTSDDFNEGKNPLLKSNPQVTFNPTHLVASWPVEFKVFPKVAARFIILMNLFKPGICTALGRVKKGENSLHPGHFEVLMNISSSHHECWSLSLLIEI